MFEFLYVSTTLYLYKVYKVIIISSKGGNNLEPQPLPLPTSLSSYQIKTGSGLTQHILEAGDPGKPLIILMHGFPEIAYSWRYVMPALAEAGYWVVAPDNRGFGRTKGWENGYDCDLSSFSMINLVRDNLALIKALGRENVHLMVGHDFGASLTAWSALIRPDIIKRIVLMSAPFTGAPKISQSQDQIYSDLLALERPRKHYRYYFSERLANDDMAKAPQGLHNFLRAYFHMKSGDWDGPLPHPLSAWTANELAKLPKYYVMEANKTMAETVASEMPIKSSIANCKWLSEADLGVYANEFARTGLQGGLNWYRCGTSESFRRELSVFEGCQIGVPATFLAGRRDWGWAQVPGAMKLMEDYICKDYRGTHLIDHAGHWVQQERSDAVIRVILKFLRET